MKRIIPMLLFAAVAFYSCTVRDEMAYMDQRISSIESTTAELVKKEVEAQMQEANRILAQVGKTTDSLKAYVLVVSGNLDALEKKEDSDYKLLGKSISDVEAKTDSLSRSLAAMQSSVSDISEWKDSVTAHLGDLYNLKSQITAIQTGITTIRGEVNALSSRCDGLTSDIGQAKTDIAGLKVELGKLASKEALDIQTITSSLTDLTSTVTTLSGTVSSNYNTLKGYINTLNTQTADLFTLISGLDGKISAETSARETAVSEINGRIATINSSVETLNGSLAALAGRVGTNEKSISELKTLTDNMHSGLEDCCADIDNLSTRMQALEGRVGLVESSVGSLQEKYDEIVASVQSMTLVPEYTDGIVEVTNGSNVLNFDVRPVAAAKKLASMKTVFSMTGYSAKTKASVGKSYSFSVDGVKFNESTNLVEVTVNTSNLSENFFNGNEGATAVLALKSGISDRTSEYFSLYAVVSVLGVSIPSELSFSDSDIYQFIPVFTPEKATNRNVSWSIAQGGSKTAATISSNGMLRAVQDGDATVTVTSEDGGYKATCKVHVKSDVVAVKQITLNPTTISAKHGDKAVTLVATVLPSNATNKTVLWSTDNPSVATVSNGTVSFVGGGNAVITARSAADQSIAASCTVQVSEPVTGVQFNKKSVALTVGQSEILSYTVLPTNATNKNVSFTVSGSASCISLDSGTAKVTAVSAGTATVRVTTSDGGFCDDCEIVCTQNPTSVSISPSAAQTMYKIGETKKFTATVSPAAASQSVVWSSSNKAVATIDEGGLLTAVGAGKTVITATAEGGKKAEVNVTVTLVTGISLSLNSGMSSLGYFAGSQMDKDKLIATVKPSTALQDVTFKSSNTSVATIDDSGLITVIGAGTVVFTATATDGTDFSESLTVPVYGMNKIGWSAIKSVTSNYPQPDPKASATGYCGTGTPWAAYGYGYGEPNWCHPYSSGQSGISTAASDRSSYLYQPSYMMDGKDNTCYCTSFDIWKTGTGWTLASIQTEPHYIQLNFNGKYKAVALKIKNPTQDFCLLTRDRGADIYINGTTYGIWYPTTGTKGTWNTDRHFYISKGADIGNIRIQEMKATDASTDWLGFINNEMSGWQQTYGCFGIAEIEIYAAE